MATTLRREQVFRLQQALDRTELGHVEKSQLYREVRLVEQGQQPTSSLQWFIKGWTDDAKAGA